MLKQLLKVAEQVFSIFSKFKAGKAEKVNEEWNDYKDRASKRTRPKSLP